MYDQAEPSHASQSESNGISVQQQRNHAQQSEPIAKDEIVDQSPKAQQAAQLKSVADRFVDKKQPIQRVKDLPSGAKVLEQSDVREKRQQLEPHIKRFDELGKPEQAKKLRDLQNETPELEQDEVLFQNVRAAQEPGVIYALYEGSPNAPYYVFPTNYGVPTEEVDATIANGTYQFVVTTTRPNEVLLSPILGHYALAKGKPVWYAGTAFFNNGALTRWNNDTGHYRTTPEYSQQADRATTDDFRSSILPQNKFVPI